MLMMLALTLRLLLDAFDVVAYAVDDDDNADAKMTNAPSQHVVVLMPTLMPLRRQLMLLMMQY